MTATVALAVLAGAGCGGLSKSDALDVVKHDVHEEATCTLPVAILSKLKMQYTTKAACAPRDDTNPTAKDPAAECLAALVSAGATKSVTPAYMAEWPDEVASASFDSLSPYERRARSLVFKSCVEMRGLREGRFRCGEAQAEKVLHVTKSGDAQASVQYARAITLDPTLAAVEAACGAVSRPPPEATVTLEKVDKKWTLAHDDAPASSH